MDKMNAPETENGGVVIWHRYPDRKPPKDGRYLISLDTKARKVSIGVYSKIFEFDLIKDYVTAWAYPPQPYTGGAK